jgi:hypothetical protein
MSVETNGRAMRNRWDRVFAVASADPRRQIVAALLEAPPERELDLPEAANPPYVLRDPERLYNELVHEHLPVMAAEGFVTWEREPLRVARGPNFEEIAVVIETLQSKVDEIPPQLVAECQRLERHREDEER